MSGTLDFPNAPVAGQTATLNGRAYQFDGVKWVARPVPSATAPVLPDSLIDNGCFRVDQRQGAAGVVVPNNDIAYAVDRWAANRSGGAGFSVSRGLNGAVFACGHYLRATVTSAGSYSPSEYAMPFLHGVEGLRCLDLAWGTAGARPLTVGFEFRSSLTGTFAVSLRNGNGTRSRAQTFSYATPNVVQRVAITFPGDTSGTWAVDTGAGFYLAVATLGGNNFQKTPNQWSAGNFVTATGVTNWAATAGAIVDISGVSAHPGSVTAFVSRDIGREIANCQRMLALFDVAANGAYQPGGVGAAAAINFAYPVPMRAAPTIFSGPLTTVTINFNVASTEFATITPRSARFVVAQGSNAGNFVYGLSLAYANAEFL